VFNKAYRLTGFIFVVMLAMQSYRSYWYCGL